MIMKRRFLRSRSVQHRANPVSGERVPDVPRGNRRECSACGPGSLGSGPPTASWTAQSLAFSANPLNFHSAVSVGVCTPSVRQEAAHVTASIMVRPGVAARLRPPRSRRQSRRMRTAVQAADGSARQGRDLGADQRRPRRAHAEDGRGHRCGPGVRPRRGRRQDRHRRGPRLRRPCSRRRVRPAAGAPCPVLRASRSPRRARADRPRRYLRDGLQLRHGRDVVPAARAERAVAADDPQDEARHARGLAFLPDGRLGAGRAIDDGGRQRVPVDRAGAGRGHLVVPRGRWQRPLCHAAQAGIPAPQRTWRQRAAGLGCACARLAARADVLRERRADQSLGPGEGDRIDAQVTRGGKTSRYVGTRAQ